MLVSNFRMRPFAQVQFGTTTRQKTEQMPVLTPLQTELLQVWRVHQNQHAYEGRTTLELTSFLKELAKQADLSLPDPDISAIVTFLRIELLESKGNSSRAGSIEGRK